MIRSGIAGRERAVDQVDHALARLGARVDGGRRHAVEHRPARGRDVDRAEEPGVGGDRRIDQRLDRVVHRRQQRGPDEVEPGAHLGRAARSRAHISSPRTAILDPKHLLVGDLVGVEAILDLVDAGRDGGDAGARHPLRVVEQRVARRQHEGAAVLLAQRLEALHAEPVRRHLGAQVVQALVRHLAVEQDQVEHVLLDRARPGRAAPAGCAAPPGRCGHGRDRRSRRGARCWSPSATTSPSRKTGSTITMSGRCVPPPVYASLPTKMSPGANLRQRVARRHVLDHAHQRAEVHRDVHRLASVRPARVEETPWSCRAAPSRWSSRRRAPASRPSPRRSRRARCRSPPR